MRSLLLTLALALGPGAAHAIDEADTIEDAIEQGYTPRPADEPAGSLLGGVIGLAPGFLVHGLGHFYVGDRAGGVKLLVAELAGISLLVADVLIGAATNESGTWGAPRQVLRHAGIVLFVGSWAADVIGAFKGYESFEQDTTRQRGGDFSLGYRYTFDPLTPFRHHLVMRLALDGGRIYARPLVDLADGLRRYEMDLGTRLFRGDDPQNQFAVGARLQRRELAAYGAATRGVMGYAAVKTDLGQALPSLRYLYLVSRVGVGGDWYSFEDSIDSTPGILDDAAFVDRYLLLETGVSLNSGPRTRLEVLFVQDPTRDIPPFGDDLGLVQAGLTHQYLGDLNIEFTLTAGQGWGVWLGLGYGL
jgi:hypothetical protein